MPDSNDVHRSATTPRVDVAIICALREELEAVLDLQRSGLASQA